MMNLIFSLFVISSVLAQPSPTEIYFPLLTAADDTWATISAAEAGWNPDKLRAAENYARDFQSTSLLILYKGKILSEKYWQGWNARRAERIFSCGKSIVAILVGLAQESGLLKINDPVSKYRGKGWSKASADEESKITLKHLLNMTSGLGSGLKPEGPAGTIWFYN